MSEQAVVQETSADAILMDIYAKTEVVKSQQTDINRRIGTVEKKIDEVISLKELVAKLTARVDELEDQVASSTESKTKVKDWFWQAIVTMLATTAAFAVGSYFGVEVKN